jgi:hypothetical protein
MADVCSGVNLGKHFVAPRERRCAWCAVELVVRSVACGRVRRRSWIAEAPTPELPPRMRTELIVEVVRVLFIDRRKGSGRYRPLLIADAAVM